MKKFTLFIVLLFFSIGQSQSLKLGFEIGESGGYTSAFGNAPAPVLETGTGTNTTSVLKIVGNTTGEPWQGFNFNLTSPVTLTTNKTMTIDVLSATPITFLVKVNGGVSGAPEAAAAVTHNGNGLWQTLSFTFNTSLDSKAVNANGTYNNFVIHTYWEEERTQFFTPTTVPRPARTFYVDNISQPIPAAPTQPSRLSSDVISVFAGAYSDVTGTNFNPNWGQASNWPNNFTTPSYGGDTALRYQNSGTYQGTRLGSNINVTDINKLHVNIYSPTITSLRLFLIKTDGGTVERFVTIPLTPNTWNTVNIDVNATTFPGLDLSLIREIKYDQFAANSTLIIDNFYFWREAGAVPSPTITGFSVPAQILGVAPFQLTAPTSDSSGAFSYSSSNTAVATVSGSTVTVTGIGSTVITANQAAVPGEFAAGNISATLNVTPQPAPNPPVRNSFDVKSYYSDSNAGGPSSVYAVASTPNWIGSQNSDVLLSGNTARLFNTSGTEAYTNAQLSFANAQDVSQMTTLHLDIFSVNQNPLQVTLNNIGPPVVIATPVNGWTSIDIPLSSFPAGVNRAAITNIRIDHTAGAQTPLRVAYFDNIYFYRPQTDTPPTLGTFTVPAKVLGDAPFTLTPPTSNSSGAWSYTISPAGIATISGDVVTIIGGGTATISANQAPVAGQFGPGLANASFVVTFPDPGPSPIPPVRDADRVISLYTGDESIYATVPNYNLGQAFWSTGGGRVLTEIPNGTNTALRVDGLGFMGLIDIGNPPPLNRERRLNLVGTGMTHLNIDIYLDAPRPNLFLVLLAPNDRLYNTGPLAAGWNNVRVPLTAYPGPLNDIYGLKIEQNYATPFRLFIDNIYFSNDFYTFYADADGDGFGNINVSTLAETAPVGYVSNSTDCDDTNANVWQIGDFYIDIDGDGYSFDGIVYPVCYGATTPQFYNPTSLGVDCNDFNPSVYRNADFYTDADGDGYSATPGTIVTTVCYGAVLPVLPGLTANTEVDCDDADATINPNTLWYLDNDGDGFGNPDVTLALTQCDQPLGYVLNNLDCDDNDSFINPNTIWYVDADNDGFGSVSMTLTQCEQPQGYVLQSGDCNDNDATINPNTLWYLDNDGDGFGNPDVNLALTQCDQQLGYVLNNLDCDDNDSFINPNTIWYVDADNDGFGSVSMTLTQCEQPQGYVLQSGDCNDNDAAINPVATEICYDGIDNNCDGSLFEGCAPIAIQITSSTCGGTNQGLNNSIQSSQVNLGEGFVVGYRFEVTNTETGEVRTIDRNVHHFKLTMFGDNFYNYGTTYTIRVAAIVNGEVQPYNGTTCSITTTTVGNTSIVASQCGTSLATMASSITAVAVNPSPSKYRFRVARADAPTTFYYIERTVPNFNLTMVGGLPLTFDTEYLVAVQIRVKLSGFESWSQWSTASCSVFTPAAPITALIEADCQFEATSTTDVIHAIEVPGATMYRFLLLAFDFDANDEMIVVYEQFVDTPNPYFTLSMFTGILSGVNYSVSVSAQLFGTFIPYGKECSVTYEEAVPMMRTTKDAITSNVFKASANPNPFKDSFNLDIKRNQTAPVQVTVYDMMGRLLENKTITVDQANNTNIGSNYPTGIYNVVITQGDEIRTLRVVKQ